MKGLSVCGNIIYRNLLMCAGAFRARRNQVWQLVMSKGGIKGGYTYSNNPRLD